MPLDVLNPHRAARAAAGRDLNHEGWQRFWTRLLGLPSVASKLPPIGRHVTPQVVRYGNDRLLLVMRVAGMPFESVSTTLIRNHCDALNRTLAALAMDKGNRLSITTTLMRRRMAITHAYRFRSTLMQRFSAKYLARFAERDYFENAFYLSFLLKTDSIAEGAIELEDLGRSMMKALTVYDPEILATYEQDGMLWSEVFTYLGELVNGVAEPQPVTAHPLRDALSASWLHWGYDTLEFDAPAQRRYAQCFDLNVFPRAKAGQTDPMLTLPAEFTLTQTFGCTGTYVAQKAVTAQLNKLTSAGDKATHEHAELEQALAYLNSRELAFGDYHAALVVYGDTDVQARAHGELVAAAALNHCQMRWIKATRSARYTYFSQVPGASIKPRPMFKSTRNLAATFSMHNYSTGKGRGNPIGDGTAVMPLQTVGKSLYHFNFHASREDQDNTGEKLAGHTVILGATGTGKTGLQTTLVGFLERFDPKLFALDVDHGMEIWIEQLGGRYFSLEPGVPTGLAPFELPDTPRNRDFLYDLVGVLGRDVDARGNPFLSASDTQKIKLAVDTVYGLDPQDRCLSRLLESIPEDSGDGLHSRLAKWCHATDGRFAWVFDNPPGSMRDITQERRVGFDVTAFLKEGYAPSEPVLAYLLHLKDLMQEEGGLLATIVEEFWLPLKFRMTQELILKVLKTGRKLEEFMILVSQSPEEAIASPIWPAIRDQCATKIYLPNPEGEWTSYQRCNLTEREFTELKKLSKESRTFLIKQGNQSVFAMLDLYGFDDELAVLSGSADNVAIWRPIWRAKRTEAEQLLASESNPAVRDACLQAALDDAMAEFQRTRKGKRQGAAQIHPTTENNV
jgi:type IV secretion system protein VirB4